MHALCAMSQWKTHIIWCISPCSTGVTYLRHPLALHGTPFPLWLMQGYLLQTNTLLTFVMSPLLCHPSMLHEPSNVSSGPAWSLHFPPLTTCLVHPSWLQSLVFAPWAMHTPLNWACLVHPSLLQVFICLVPCLEHTSPVRIWLLHPPRKQHRAFIFSAATFSSHSLDTAKHMFSSVLFSPAFWQLPSRCFSFFLWHATFIQHPLSSSWAVILRPL